MSGTQEHVGCEDTGSSNVVTESRVQGLQDVTNQAKAGQKEQRKQQQHDRSAEAVPPATPAQEGAPHTGTEEEEGKKEEKEAGEICHSAPWHSKVLLMEFEGVRVLVDVNTFSHIINA